MKKSMINRIFLLALVSMSYLLAGAQGVVVCKKDGTRIKVPYAELDSISTYNYEEDPQGGYDSKAKTFTANGVSFTMMPVEEAPSLWAQPVSRQGIGMPNFQPTGLPSVPT